MLNDNTLNIRDVFDSMYPFYIFCQIFSIDNFKIVNVKDRRSYKVTAWALSKYILQFIILVAFFIMAYQTAIEEGYCSPNIFSGFLVCCIDITTTMMYTVGVIIFLLGSGKIISIMNSIYNIDIEFKKLKIITINWYVWLRIMY